MNKLKELDLSETGISDAGLVQLKGLRSLRELNLGFTKISGVGFVP
jgi:hypothetical protein